jgi:hypothetical protein
MHTEFGWSIITIPQLDKLAFYKFVTKLLKLDVESRSNLTLIWFPQYQALLIFREFWKLCVIELSKFYISKNLWEIIRKEILHPLKTF